MSQTSKTHTPLRIGTRGSSLALAQCRQWRDGLVKSITAKSKLEEGEAEHYAPLVIIRTQGDKILDRRLIEAGGKALFTKEIEDKLLQGEIDLAVHSLKDVPFELAQGTTMAAIPAREDPRDAFLSLNASCLSELKHEATIGTASLRRQAQTLKFRPDLKIEMLRGNVDTRLKKLHDGEFDAILLAAAGLNRLGLSSHIRSYIDPILAPCAPGQGALFVQCRTGDEANVALKAVHDPLTALCVSAERGMLQALEASCRTAVGAYATYEDGTLYLIVEALSPDGVTSYRREASLIRPTIEEAAMLGARLGENIRHEAKDSLIWHAP